MKIDRAAPGPAWDSLWINVNLATLADPDPAAGYGAIEKASIAVTGERIAWLGKMEDLPAAPRDCAATVHDGKGRWLTPGLIDCHTHLVFGGDRAAEFEQRLQGVSYEQIARAGGGIRSTLAATRAATQEELVASAGKRLRFLLDEGVTTVEIKSGYGLETDTELRMLRAARQLQQRYPVDIRTTFLGAHALPPEYEGRRADYITLLCDTMLPAVAAEKLADAVDAFCESIGFTEAETECVFSTAHRLGLPVKLHADQLSDSNGAALAAKFDALSADHIEYSSAAGIEAMARHNTTAVLLPGAFYYLRETRPPPIECLRQHRVPMAIATDANPGSSPCVSLLLMMNMACTLFRLTPAEALAGVTRNAARALGLAADRGTLEEGKRADFVLWDIRSPAELCYWIGVNHCLSAVKNGKPVVR